MRKKEIVEKFLEKDMMLSPKTLEELSKNYSEEVLEQAKKSGHLIITKPEFQKPQKKNKKQSKQEKKTSEKKPEKPKPKARVVIDRPGKKKTLTPQDFVEQYNKRYKTLRDALLKKLPDAVSVNKLSGMHSDVESIGMIRSRKKGSFVLEDPTGSIDVVTEKEVGDDCVVGVKGFVKEGKLFLKKLIFPDVPLNRTIQTINGANLILSPEERKSSDLVLTKKSLKTNPCWGQVRDGSSALDILVYNPDKETSIEQVKDWLRRRHLPERSSVQNPDNRHFIDPVPDIFWVLSGDRKADIYKGVTIICSEKSPARIDLGNLKVSFE